MADDGNRLAGDLSQALWGPAMFQNGFLWVAVVRTGGSHRLNCSFLSEPTKRFSLSDFAASDLIKLGTGSV